MNTSKHTLVLGASKNTERYSNLAIHRLLGYKHQVSAIGQKSGEVAGVTIHTDLIDNQVFDTVTLYLNPTNQQPYYDYIIGLKPQRVIFNPGTENDELQQLLVQHNIPYMEACTLVMLSTGQY